MTYHAYSGIGSRKTPVEIQDQMTMIATHLAYHNIVLRSGGAEGADQAFERGVPDARLKEIYLPWPKFNGYTTGIAYPSQQALDIARQFHPAWDGLRDGGKALMARNTHQVLGIGCDHPVLFILCWTPQGSGSGGTGQAIRIARHLSIPVFDMGSLSLTQIEDGLNELLAPILT